MIIDIKTLPAGYDNVFSVCNKYLLPTETIVQGNAFVGKRSKIPVFYAKTKKELERILPDFGTDTTEIITQCQGSYWLGIVIVDNSNSY